MFGFLNIYKPKGKTSHDIVAIIRRITKIKQIGHTGTLDPFAEGVLPICIGKATRLIEYLNDNKAYIGTIQLGESTTTYDIEGETVNTSNKLVSIEEIKDALRLFTGEIEQIPPVYSAIKVKGKKLYEYARKNVEVEIPKRKVTISQLDIISYDQQKRQLELYIACSKGTYIRSIANDLGENLGTYGHLVKLVRVKAGDFTLENSVTIDKLETVNEIENYLKNPLEYLDYQRYELNTKEKELVSHGMEINVNLADGITVLADKNEIIAIGESKNNIFKCKKVFI